MAQADTEGKVFYRTMHGGFGIYNPTAVLNKVLIELEEISQKFILDANRDLLVTIEFARADYQQALNLFRDDFRKDAYFLYIETNLETCKERIHKRYFSAMQPDDYFVDDDIMDSYYNVDSRRYMLADFKKDFGIENERIRIIDNEGTWEECIVQVNQFIASIFEEKKQ